MNTFEEFYQVARDYCEFVEAHSRFSRSTFLERARIVLPTLYLGAIELPTMPPTTLDAGLSVSSKGWTTLCNAISEKLGPADLYWEIYDPTVKPLEQPVTTTISDDLSDIWRDLKPGVEQWTVASRSEKQVIVSGWQFNFKYHWSSHLVDALRTINWLLEPEGIVPSDCDGQQ